MKQYVLIHTSLPEFQERALGGYIFGSFIEGVYDNEKAVRVRSGILRERGVEGLVAVPVTTEKGFKV